MAETRGGRLDRQKVTGTALRLLNEVGLEGLTLRAIAKELDVKAPALYWHFKDKKALLDEMATEMLRRMNQEFEEAPEDWREALARSMRGLRDHLLRYRDGARVFSGTRLTDTSFAGPMEAHLAALTHAGFAPAAAARAWHTAYSFTVGFVIEEQGMGEPGGGAPGAGPGPDLEARAESLAGYPLAARAAYEYFRDYDRGFEQGLGAVIAGVGLTLRTEPDGPPDSCPG